MAAQRLMLAALMSDRRRFPRMNADVVCRPAGLALAHHRRTTSDISLGGMRVFSDESFEIGSKLDLDVLVTDGSQVRCWAMVVWVLGLEPGAAARFDVGLKFTDMAPPDIQRLASVLSSAS
jgi:c-di-GMP-binding flagellar brake protein YcgR